jgi:DNA-binding MarR family transcriptional regulator
MYLSWAVGVRSLKSGRLTARVPRNRGRRRHIDAELGLKENDQMPGHLARRFQQIAVAIFHAEVEACGSDLTPVQYAALLAIYRRPGVDQITLAGLIAYDRTTITGVIDRLERKGLVTRTVNGSDRRARELRTTAAGTDLLLQIQPAVDAAQDVLLSGLSPSEAERLMELLRKAIQAVNELSRAPLR